MGWKEDKGLGKEQQGRTEPIRIDLKYNEGLGIGGENVCYIIMYIYVCMYLYILYI